MLRACLTPRIMAAVTSKQVAIVKATVPVLQEHGTTITRVFYQNMLGENPELRNIFNKTSQADMRQPRALANAVLAYAIHIEEPEKLSAAVSRIAHKHVSLQVTPEQYDIVGRYLIQAIGQVLGSAATPEIVDAWTAAYGQLAKLFIGVEKRMYKANAAEGWVGWRKFKIARKVPESDNITSFYIEPVDSETSLPRFLPGQYVSLQLKVPELGHLQSRQYSLSEALHGKGKYYRISVKRDDGEEAGIPGIISQMLHKDYAVGDVVEISHPQGEFFVDPKDTDKAGVPAVLISGGVGATPMMAILESLVANPPWGQKQTPVERPISWIHASRTRPVLPFAHEVEKICRENQNVSANVFLDEAGSGDQDGVNYRLREGTLLNLATLDGGRDLHLDNPRTEYFICGPEAFMVKCRGALEEMGVDRSRVQLELFATGEVDESAK